MSKPEAELDYQQERRFAAFYRARAGAWKTAAKKYRELETEDGWICSCGCSADIRNRIRAALGGNDVRG
jgi:hypothetical protein